MTVSEATAATFDQWEIVLAEGTFEETLSALEQIVTRLDEGHLTLNDAVRCYELGVLLARRCEKMLDEAELRITRLDQQPSESEVKDLAEDPPD
jgi:exodeoxyribonuclease VII small subunit